MFWMNKCILITMRILHLRRKSKMDIKNTVVSLDIQILNTILRMIQENTF